MEYSMSFRFLPWAPGWVFTVFSKVENTRRARQQTGSWRGRGRGRKNEFSYKESELPISKSSKKSI